MFVSTSDPQLAQRRRDAAVKAPTVEQLEKELLYWKGVVRGARAELFDAGRLSNAEYANLAQDSKSRDYVDRVDSLKDLVKEAFLEAAVGKVDPKQMWESSKSKNKLDVL